MDQGRIIQHPVSTENTMKKIDDLMVRPEELICEISYPR